MESFWRSWDNSLSELLLYYYIFLLCYKRYILFWRVRVGGGVQGLAYHSYDKVRSQFHNERIFWK